MKKWCIGSFLAIVLLVVGIVSFHGIGHSKEVIKTSALHPSFSSIDEMLDKSSLVVVGTVVGVEKPQDININGAEDRDKNPIYRVYTVSNLKIDKLLKGDVAVGDIISIKQQGGETDKQIVETDGIKYLMVGDKGLFFLETYLNGVPCDMLNPYQASVVERNGVTISGETNNLFPSGTSLNGAIETTLKDCTNSI